MRQITPISTTITNLTRVTILILLITGVTCWDIVRECRLSTIDKQSKIITRGTISYMRSGEAEISIELVKNGKERDFITGRIQGCSTPRGSSCSAGYEGYRVNETITDDIDNELPAEFSSIDAFGQWMRLRITLSQRGCRRQTVTLTIDQCVNKNLINATSGCSNVDLTDIARGINRTIELELLTLDNIRSTNALLVETKNSVISRADIIESSINLMLIALSNVSTTAITSYNTETSIAIANYITNITEITQYAMQIFTDGASNSTNSTDPANYIAVLNATTSAVIATLGNLSELQQGNHREVMTELAKITGSITDMSSVVRVSLLLLQDIRKNMNLSLDYNVPQTDNSTILTLLNIQQQNSARLINIENLLSAISNYSQIDGENTAQSPPLNRWDNILQIFIASGVGATLISSVLPTLLICFRKKSDSVTQL